MVHHDEYEMLVEYSEMAAFNFKSKEFQEVRKDYLECKSRVSGLFQVVMSFINKFRPVGSY